MDGVSLHDRGLTLGDGLFETVLAEDGGLRRLPDHLARLARGCAELGLPAPAADEVRSLMLAALVQAGLEQARAAVRLTLTAGSGGRGLDRPQAPEPVLFATAAPSPKPQTPARLVIATVRRNEHSPASRLKTLSYLDNVLARDEARRAGADEAVMLNTAGRVACAAAANLFWIEAGALKTPALDCGVLAGVTRAAVLGIAPGLGLLVEEVQADAARLKAAEAIFLTNSLIGLRPVSSLDGRPLGGWPELARLSAAWEARP